MNCLPCFRSEDKTTERAISTKAASPVDYAKENTSSSNAQTFTFRELAMATKNFRQECLLGEGGFGRVFKGKLRSSGQVVAVKQLDRNGMQESKEFHVEVLMLSLLRHPNLVNLIGYCADGDQRLLVYEFMPMGSLEHHLFADGPDKKPLDWVARMNIAAGAAKGLEYLHEKANPPIIYRDLKPSNVLLDESFEPKLSDFGLAKLGPGGGKMQPASRVMGTYGYSSPEYSRSGELTLKSDIYNFGVVLLELITGRRVIDTTRPNDEQNLVTWAQPIFRDPKRFPELADSRLNKNFPVTSLNQAVGIAAMCLQEEPSVRPLIGDVVAALSFITVSPNKSIQPSISTGDAPSIDQPNVYTPPPEQKMEYGDDVRRSTSIKSGKDGSDHSDGSSSDSEDEHSDRENADLHCTPSSHTSDQDVAHLENDQHSNVESDSHSYRSDYSDGESIYHSDGSEEDSVDHDDSVLRQGSSENNKDDDISLNQGSARISATDRHYISSIHGTNRETKGAVILSDHCSRLDASDTSSSEHDTSRKSLTNQLGSSSKLCSSKKLDKRASNRSGKRSTSRRKSSKHRTVVTFKEPSMNSRYNRADKSELTEPNAESSKQLEDEHHRPALETLENGSSIMVDMQDMQTNAFSRKENNRSSSNSSSSDSSNDEHEAQDDLHNHRVFDNNKGNMQPNLRHVRTR